MSILVALAVAAVTLASSAAHTYTTLHQFAVASAAVNDTAFRLYRDARAAKAIDVLPTDVNGASNADGHEFEILYQNVDGTLQLARYTYAASTGSWQRCVQSSPTGSCTVDGVPQTGISVFQAVVVTAPELADPSSTHYIPVLSSNPANAPTDVELATQWAGIRAGNHAVEVRIADAKQDLTVDLAPGSAVTAGLTEISGTYTPPPPGTCTYVASYSGSSSTGWTAVDGSALWQWYQAPPSCANAATPPPVSYVESYAPACPAQFYTPQTGTATWQQQPAPNATTPPPSTVIVGYDASDAPIYQTFAWNQGPCPAPTQPALPNPPTTENVCDVAGNANYNPDAGQTIGNVTYVGVSTVPPCAAAAGQNVWYSLIEPTHGGLCTVVDDTQEISDALIYVGTGAAPAPGVIFAGYTAAGTEVEPLLEPALDLKTTITATDGCNPGSGKVPGSPRGGATSTTYSFTWTPAIQEDTNAYCSIVGTCGTGTDTDNYNNAVAALAYYSTHPGAPSGNIYTYAGLGEAIETYLVPPSDVEFECGEEILPGGATLPSECG